MTGQRQFLDSIRTAAVALLLIAGTQAARAADTYDGARLTIPTVTIGAATYTNMVVTVGGIVSGPGGSSPNGDIDSYDPQSHQLTVPSVTYAGKPYYNLVVTVGTLVSVQSVAGADTYDGASLAIPAVQVAGGAIYDNVTASISQIVSIGGGMPAASQDVYDPVKAELLIVAGTYKGRVYTNVTVKAGKVVSIGPNNLAAVPGNGQITLSWSASPGATSYSICQGLTSGGEGSTPVATVTASPNPTAIITGLTNGSIYFFTVAAVSAGITSGPSAEVSGAPLSPQVANGSLAAGVIVLTATQNSQVAAETSSLVTFNGSISLPQGTVFLTADNAYVADTTTTAGGQTLVAVHAPQVDDVFSSLRIAGTFPATSGSAGASAAAYVSRNNATHGVSKPYAPSLSGTLTQTIPINNKVGGFSATGTLTTNLTVDLDFNFSSGTLQSAHVTVNQANALALTAGFSTGTSASQDLPLTTLVIPIPVTVVDALLNTVGVRVAAMRIPVSVVLSGSVQFDSSALLTGSTAANAVVSYSAGGAPAVTGAMTATADMAVSPTSISMTGDPVGATVTAQGGLALHLRPALAFLNQVALLGADIQAGLSAKLVAQVIAETPPYCIDITQSVDGEASAFFKTVGLSLTSKSLSFNKDLPPPILIGSCTLVTNVSGTVDTSTLPASYYNDVQVDVSVTPQSPSQAGSKVPTGTVTVNMSGNSCVATLGSTGSGSCLLPASPAGTAIPFDLTYGGDNNFAASANQSAVDVLQSATVTGATASTAFVANSPVSFSVSVGAAPTINAPGIQDPSGTVNIVDPTGKTLCVAQLNANGTGSCSAVYGPAMTGSLTANYSGDTNYAGSSGSVTVPAPSGYWLATISLVGCTYNNIYLGCNFLLPYVTSTLSSWQVLYSLAGSTDRDVIVRGFGNGATIESVLANVFSASDPSFSWSGPDPFPVQAGNGVNSLTFTVDPTQTSNAAMGGTWVSSSTDNNLGILVSGSWSAVLLKTKKPAPVMNGNQLCENVCFNSSSSNCGVIKGVITPNTCTF